MEAKYICNSCKRERNTSYNILKANILSKQADKL